MSFEEKKLIKEKEGKKERDVKENNIKRSKNPWFYGKMYQYLAYTCVTRTSHLYTV
jgi:hypothetical protein